MRALIFSLVMAAATSACGGGSRAPAGPAPAPAPRGSEDPEVKAMAAHLSKPWCDRHWDATLDAMRFRTEHPADEPAPSGEELAESLERCREATRGLSAEQLEWLDACGDCGHTSDAVMDCVHGVPPPPVEPYECHSSDDLGGPGDEAPGAGDD